LISGGKHASANAIGVLKYQLFERHSLLGSSFLGSNLRGSLPERRGQLMAILNSQK
jgi:hypothetical protein